MSDCVLVTGGAGYIGSHACKALFRAGYTPLVYDNLSTGHLAAVKWGSFEKGDILDRAHLDRVFKRSRPVAVMHFAALAYVAESVTDPSSYYRNNVIGSLNILDCMRDHSVGKLVFSSTCAVYGAAGNSPIDEHVSPNPINPYGASKLMVERIVADFSAAYGMDWIALRYFNAAGADPDGELGESHDPETHLIPNLLAAASQHRGPVTIFGSDYETSDGSCIRDYIHVSDLADAHVFALKALRSHNRCEIVNLGNCKGFSVLEVIASVERVTGLQVPISFGERRVGDPPQLISNSARAETLLGWSPNFSELDDIVRSAWNWYQVQPRTQNTA